MKIPKEDLKNYVGKKIHNPNTGSSDCGYLRYVGNICLFLVNDEGLEFIRSVNSTWETYEEPLQKVKMWQALVKDYNGDFIASRCFYASAEAAKLKMIGDNEFIKLLHHTEIEVEV